jgi:hypothetical protein
MVIFTKKLLQIVCSIKSVEAVLGQCEIILSICLYPFKLNNNILLPYYFRDSFLSRILKTY